eukprot:gene3258-546_t
MPSGTSDGWLEAANEITKMIISNRCNADDSAGEADVRSAGSNLCIGFYLDRGIISTPPHSSPSPSQPHAANGSSSAVPTAATGGNEDDVLLEMWTVRRVLPPLPSVGLAVAGAAGKINGRLSVPAASVPAASMAGTVLDLGILGKALNSFLHYSPYQAWDRKSGGRMKAAVRARISGAEFIPKGDSSVRTFAPISLCGIDNGHIEVAVTFRTKPPVLQGGASSEWARVSAQSQSRTTHSFQELPSTSTSTSTPLPSPLPSSPAGSPRPALKRDRATSTSAIPTPPRQAPAMRPGGSAAGVVAPSLPTPATPLPPEPAEGGSSSSSCSVAKTATPQRLEAEAAVAKGLPVVLGNQNANCTGGGGYSASAPIAIPRSRLGTGVGGVGGSSSLSSRSGGRSSLGRNSTSPAHQPNSSAGAVGSRSGGGGGSGAFASSSSSSNMPKGLLGSFEESMFTGRMCNLGSNLVSGFMAKLGASGSGKTPVQVTVPMSAQFYHVQEETTPSPYVGVIGLGGNQHGGGDDVDGAATTRPFPKGRYRVPAKGLVQLMVYNPERTGIKLFVVPYDFRKMPANTHTFLRQRTVTDPARSAAAAAAAAETPAATAAGGGGSSSSGNSGLGGGRIVALAAVGAGVGAGVGASALTATAVAASSPSRLVYAVHLRFVCTKRGRVFLHKEIQVVFPHRAPDSTTKLNTFTEGPQDPTFIQTSPVKQRARAVPPPLYEQAAKDA